LALGCRIPQLRGALGTGKSLSFIAAVTGDFCPACAESVLDAAESNRVMREMTVRRGRDSLKAAGQRR
jgi:hypothetical protein